MLEANLSAWSTWRMKNNAIDSDNDDDSLQDTRDEVSYGSIEGIVRIICTNILVEQE